MQHTNQNQSWHESISSISWPVSWPGITERQQLTGISSRSSPARMSSKATQPRSEAAATPWSAPTKPTASATTPWVCLVVFGVSLDVLWKMNFIEIPSTSEVYHCSMKDMETSDWSITDLMEFATQIGPCWCRHLGLAAILPALKSSLAHSLPHGEHVGPRRTQLSRAKTKDFCHHTCHDSHDQKSSGQWWGHRVLVNIIWYSSVHIVSVLYHWLYPSNSGWRLDDEVLLMGSEFNFII